MGVIRFGDIVRVKILDVGKAGYLKSSRSSIRTNDVIYDAEFTTDPNDPNVVLFCVTSFGFFAEDDEKRNEPLGMANGPEGADAFVLQSVDRVSGMKCAPFLGVPNCNNKCGGEVRETYDNRVSSHCPSDVTNAVNHDRLKLVVNGGRLSLFPADISNREETACKCFLYYDPVTELATVFKLKIGDYCDTAYNGGYVSKSGNKLFAVPETQIHQGAAITLEVVGSTDKQRYTNTQAYRPYKSIKSLLPARW